MKNYYDPQKLAYIIEGKEIPIKLCNWYYEPDPEKLLAIAKEQFLKSNCQFYEARFLRVL